MFIIVFSDFCVSCGEQPNCFTEPFRSRAPPWRHRCRASDWVTPINYTRPQTTPLAPKKIALTGAPKFYDTAPSIYTYHTHARTYTWPCPRSRLLACSRGGHEDRRRITGASEHHWRVCLCGDPTVVENHWGVSLSVTVPRNRTASSSE